MLASRKVSCESAQSCSAEGGARPRASGLQFLTEAIRQPRKAAHRHPHVSFWRSTLSSTSDLVLQLLHLALEVVVEWLNPLLGMPELSPHFCR
jgi:hypothetical protein